MSTIKTEPARRTFLATSFAIGVAAIAQPIPAQSQTRSSPMATTIRAGSDITTLISIFTVEPEHQQELVAALKEGTEAFFSKMPGFISSSALNGKNGRQVINYSQWRSVQDIEAFRQNPNFGPYIQRIAALAKSESILCDVAFVHAI
jgi:quinol monooxygenase YgiN